MSEAREWNGAVGCLRAMRLGLRARKGEDFEEVFIPIDAWVIDEQKCFCEEVADVRIEDRVIGGLDWFVHLESIEVP